MLSTLRHDPTLLDSPVRLRLLAPPLRSRVPDAALQELVSRAVGATGFPLAVVSLVLEQTQLLRAHVGLPPGLALTRETQREHGFCQYLVTGGQALEVYDAQAEPRLPQVLVRAHGLRAYVGIPLRLQGQVVGGLCVMDVQPRALTEAQRSALRALAACAERRLEELVAGTPYVPPKPGPDFEERVRECVEAARRAVGLPPATRAAPQGPTPSRQEEPAPEVAYQHTLEGLFHKGLQGRVTPALVARLQPLGVDLSRPLEPTYPRAVYQRALEATALELWPQLPPERAHFELGRCLVTGYTQTLLGRSILTMMRLLGPHVTLGRMQHNLRTGSSYSRVERVEESPTCCRLWVNEPELNPGLVQGLLDAVMQYAGVQSASVRLLSRDAQGCTYRVSWAE